MSLFYLANTASLPTPKRPNFTSCYLQTSNLKSKAIHTFYACGIFIIPLKLARGSDVKSIQAALDTILLEYCALSRSVRLAIKMPTGHMTLRRLGRYGNAKGLLRSKQESTTVAETNEHDKLQQYPCLFSPSSRPIVIDRCPDNGAQRGVVAMMGDIEASSSLRYTRATAVWTVCQLVRVLGQGLADERHDAKMGRVTGEANGTDDSAAKTIARKIHAWLYNREADDDASALRKFDILGLMGRHVDFESMWQKL